MADTRSSAGASQGVLLALVVLGAGAFVHGLMQPEPVFAWAIYLVNLLFWSSLGIVGPALAAMMQLTEARWSPSVKRVALTTSGFLPFSFVLFLILLFGLGALYPWVNNPEMVAKKREWLNLPFFAIRTVLGVLLLYWVALTFTRAVFAEGTGGDETAAHARRNRLAGTFLVLFVLVLSLWGFDLIMSLDPIWFSGLLGGYYVVSSLYTGLRPGDVPHHTRQCPGPHPRRARGDPGRRQAHLRHVRDVDVLLLLPVPRDLVRQRARGDPLLPSPLLRGSVAHAWPGSSSSWAG